MTTKHYFFSDELTMDAEVLACEPGDEGTWHVRLAGTLFHPHGGGQPSDIGRLGGARVLKVMQDETGIIHVTDNPLAAGEVPLEVDADNRRLNTRLHSAGHLIGTVGERLGWRAVKANHRPGEARVVFEAAGSDEAPAAALLSDQVNQLVTAALARNQYLEGESRWVTWGDLPAYACGGTHVRATDEVGNVLITAVKLKKGALTVSYALA